ncbi:MAG: hypothetical protein LBU94_01355 [Clostridiales bacterium]|nr:hypothetical protein [Clostridiales bacterium]
MRKVASDNNINHNKNPFDTWYDLNSEAGEYLDAGDTYYYMFYAMVDGKEFTSGVKSFTAKESRQSSSSGRSENGIDVEDGSWIINVPANKKVQGYKTPTSTTNYRKIDPQPSPIRVHCTQKVKLSNGTTRYYFTDSSGNGMYFEYQSWMSVE